MPNNKKAQTIACDVCGRRAAQTKFITRAYGKGANLLVIENVPLVVCSSCGESYLTAETLYELERINSGDSSSISLNESQRQLLDERLRQHEESPEDVEPWNKVRNDILSEL